MASNTTVTDRALGPAELLESRIRSKTAVIGIIGLGYVGLPLALEFARAGYPVWGVDIDHDRVEAVARGCSQLATISDAALRRLIREERLHVTSNFGALSRADVVIICVPTPWKNGPNLNCVVAAAQEIARRLHPCQLIVLESTVYPGTTREVVAPILASSGLRVGADYFFAFSPERVDPGDPEHSTRNIPKLVSGITSACTAAARLLFEQLVPRVHPVASVEVAELAKLLENVFRSVNIALVNEFALLCQRMNIEVWDVIDAAGTKPFGYMPFYPGPGVGGSCIPANSSYLVWKAREYDFNAKLVSLAAEINESMPCRAVERIIDILKARANKTIAGARILAVGVAYKRGLGDIRESPALRVLEQLRSRGAFIAYHDPYVPSILLDGATLSSLPLTEACVEESDCVIILTDHPTIDYAWLAAHAPLVFDTRNATRSVAPRSPRVVRL